MNNKAVNAVIGVFLMVAITVAIAATVYLYVSNTINSDEIPIEGNVTDKLIVGSPGYNNLEYWFIIDKSVEVEVDLGIFYDYEIGDYYTHIDE